MRRKGSYGNCHKMQNVDPKEAWDVAVVDVDTTPGKLYW